MRDELPSGTVTLLFTDVESSTRLLQELGAGEYADALAEHRRILRKAFSDHGGIEVDTQGDAFFVAFATAPAALTAAAEAQEGLAGGPIRVRMGLHTGAPRLAGEGYVGEDVHKAARIAAAGHGGQILFSKETRELVAVEATDLGEHRLKDFGEPVWIFQLGQESFPPLKTISNTNLPRPASSFVGRERELEEVLALVRDGARLLTLTGPGGSGKTRLAIEAAAAVVPEFRNGVFWVALAAMHDAGLVLETISQTLGAKNGLAEHIGDRELLLLLDNFEQVIEASPELSRLLFACPGLRLVVTSRERLRVQGEVAYAVPPLAESEAVALFCDRSGLAPDETIAELCRRLDQLPLAVELAAARRSVLSPGQILERLSRRLDLLKGGRDAEARQRTLRETIEWSFQLLSSAEKILFSRLAVFTGGCALDSAEAVADADLDTLQSLVDQSLLRHSEDRFWMLETIRDYAEERLEESDEAQDLRRRHAMHFLALAEEAQPKLREESTEWQDRLDRERDNLRAALDWLEASGERGLALSLAGAAWRFWYAKGYLAEGGRRLESVLDADERPTTIRARALIGASLLAAHGGDTATARAHAEEAIALHRMHEDARGLAESQLVLGLTFAAEDKVEEAQRLFDESARLFSELADEHYTLIATRHLAWACHQLGDRDRARVLGEENLRRARAQKNELVEAMTIGALAMIAVDEGRIDDALSMLRQSTRIFRALGDVLGIAMDLGRFARAFASAHKPATAVELLASSDALHERIGSSSPWVDRMKEEILATIRLQLDEAALAEAWHQGRNLTTDQAITLALDAPD